MADVSFVTISTNTFARVRRNYGTDGDNWTTTVQIYESELDDMSEVRMVEFTGKVADIVASLTNLINHVECKKTEDPYTRDRRGDDVQRR
jgi:hypothetical protein